MLRSDYEGQNCSVARALEAVGERWTLLIVRELLVRPLRFSQIERRLPIAKNTLSARLEKLTQLGIVERPTHSTGGDGQSYALTRKGADLYPVVGALMAWGDAHASPDGPPIVAKHACGGAVGHNLTCETCGGAIHHGQLSFIAGPGWRG